MQACGFAPDPRPFRDLPFWLVFGVAAPASLLVTDNLIPVREYPFAVLGIAVVQAGASDLLARFRWPDGTFNASAPIDTAAFLQPGRLMYWLDAPVLCPARSSIGLELQNDSIVADTATIVLAGFQRVYEGAK